MGCTRSLTLARRQRSARSTILSLLLGRDPRRRGAAAPTSTIACRLSHRFLELVVDQNVVVLVVVLDLAAGGDQTALDDLFRIFAAVAQSPFQRLAVRRQNEDADRIGQISLDLRGTLDVDIEQQIVPFLLRLAQELARRAVAVADERWRAPEIRRRESSARTRREGRSDTACRSARCREEGASCRRSKNRDSGRVSASSLTSVDFPEPDGAEMM